MEQKNVILAIALSFAILLGWNYWEQSQLTEKAALVTQNQSVNGVIPAPSTNNSAIIVNPDALNASNIIARPRSAILKDSARVVIISEKLNGSIRLLGAKIDDLTLTEYKETLDDNSAEVTLLHPVGSKNAYYASFGWWANKGIKTPDANSLWTSNSPRLSPGNPVILSWVSEQNITFTQTYSLDEDYMFNVTQSILNSTGKPISVAPYGLISRTGTPDVPWLLYLA